MKNRFSYIKIERERPFSHSHATLATLQRFVLRSSKIHTERKFQKSQIYSERKIQNLKMYSEREIHLISYPLAPDDLRA